MTPSVDALRAALHLRGLLRLAARTAGEHQATLDEVLGAEDDPRVSAARVAVCAALAVSTLAALVVVPAERPVVSSGPRLEVLPIDSLTSPLDRFRCEPLKAILAAGCCVDRQRQAQVSTLTTIGKEANRARSLALKFAVCRACPVGVRVAAQLSTSPQEAA